MTTFGYVRVSTQRQAEDGQSLEVQERSIRGYAMMLGREIDRVFVDEAVSGSVPVAQRPQGARLLSNLEAGDMIITPKLDRMFRSALDALETLKWLQDRKVQLHMIDLGGDVIGNGVSKLVFTILSAVAEAERDRTRERIREVKADQKRHNRFLGGKLPYGYKVDPTGTNLLVPDERRQKFIQVMLAGARDGHPLRAIQEAVYNFSHHFPPVERPSLVTISRIIKKAQGVSANIRRTPEEDLEDDYGENT